MITVCSLVLREFLRNQQPDQMTDLLNLCTAKAQHELMITNLNRVEGMSDEDPGSTCTEKRSSTPKY